MGGGRVLRPYLYVLYTFDGPIGGQAPRWGTAGADSDPCPTPPGSTADGCVVSGKLARLTLSGSATTKQDLIHDWCQQYPSHSIGDLVFGRDGALYVSGGDGASFNFVDYGQDGNPLNPCNDPPAGVGGTMTAPTAEGGALRAQDLRTAADPVTLDGTVIRVSPDTGAALADNPNMEPPVPSTWNSRPQGELFYADLNGGTIRRVTYGSGPTSCPAGQYFGEYFPNRTLTGAPAVAHVRGGRRSRHDWGTGAPAGVGPDNFSAAGRAASNSRRRAPTPSPR